VVDEVMIFWIWKRQIWETASRRHSRESGNDKVKAKDAVSEFLNKKALQRRPIKR
jgi:hypothetical protein